MVNHDDRAGREVLSVPPRQPLQRQRVLPPVLFIGVGVVAAIQAVDHHQPIAVLLLDVAELAIPLHVPLRHYINAALHTDPVELLAQHPFALITVEPKALGFRHWHVVAMHVERQPLADVFAQRLAHCRLAGATICVD